MVEIQKQHVLVKLIKFAKTATDVFTALTRRNSKEVHISAFLKSQAQKNPQKSCPVVKDSLFLKEHKDFSALLPPLLCDANADDRHRRKPIKKQQRKLLSGPAVCLATSVGGRGSLRRRVCANWHSAYLIT